MKNKGVAVTRREKGFCGVMGKEGKKDLGRRRVIGRGWKEPQGGVK